MTTQRIRVAVDSLWANCTALLQALGVPRGDADLSTDVFIQADLRGEESHGMRLFLHILGRLKAGEEFPFVLDMACATAKEKIFQAKERGERIPPGWALGPDGNTTTDPDVALATGILLPFGGYKAFGLGVAHEVLTSVLTGGPPFNGGWGGFMPYDKPMNVSMYLQAINIEWFVPLAEFKRQMDAVIRTIKASALRPGVDRIYVPGERGFLEEQRRRKEGIPLPTRVFEELRRWAEELKVVPLEAMG